MKRIELFEFEDFPWLPGVIRKSITNLIVVFHKMMGTSEVLVGLIDHIREKHAFDQIVDMGSGSGGPMPAVLEEFQKREDGNSIKILLSDLHPSPKTIKEINEKGLPNLKYHPEPVNAVKIAEAPEGLKTMVGSFHHMNPEIAKQILQSAQENREPILIYELAKNNIPVLVWTLLLPLSLAILILMSMVMTLFVRPLSLGQILFTYPIPIIPLIYAWDGQASLMRTYTFEDIEQLIGEKKENYHWEIADALKANGKKAGYYVMGYPVD